MKDNLERLEKAIEALKEDASEATATTEMSWTDFVSYVSKQIDALATDTQEVKKARLGHLEATIAAVKKNFEGPTPTPGGMIAIAMFQDPGQQSTETQQMDPGTPPAAATAHSQNDVEPAVSGPAGDTPPGGNMPPMVAGTSGFETPDMATFAKSLGELSDKIANLTKSQDPEPPKSKKDEQVEKAVWPLDMSSDFGMGRTEDPERPEWGFDADDPTVE